MQQQGSRSWVLETPRCTAGHDLQPPTWFGPAAAVCRARYLVLGDDSASSMALMCTACRRPRNCSPLLSKVQLGPLFSMLPLPTALLDDCVAPIVKEVPSISNCNDTVPPVSGRRHVVHIVWPARMYATQRPVPSSQYAMHRCVCAGPQTRCEALLYRHGRSALEAGISGSRRDLHGSIPSLQCLHTLSVERGVVILLADQPWRNHTARLIHLAGLTARCGVQCVMASNRRRVTCPGASDASATNRARDRSTLVRFCVESKRERSALC
ncbi:hypothetical protein T440DRAFT_248257 [Plenodomus tracheiphilus IPT5]|uniref:Uncharacterized protein n=1 Tax=Plenodomus tracheiphilus IPT5 TaxID=1408161 RepID=A0A6A7AS93_9PLEO|nr:hypothetical protein T440DRAFT_248257 [Plenodomus tracheiphilus IPT5]